MTLIGERLAERQCEACREDSEPVVGVAREEMLAALSDWRVEMIDEVDQLVGDFSFANFVDAMAFANAVGELAENADHHPRLVIEWGSVSVYWWTHTIRSLHLNDFILAARVTALSRE